MKKIILLAAAVAMLAAMVVPASAAVNSDVGAFTGQAKVGKSLTGNCTNSDPTGTPTGGGLGLPLVGGNPKHGWFSLETGTGNLPSVFVSALHGAGKLVACGKLGPVDVIGIGAACGISKGYDGFGRVTTGGAVKGAQSLKLGNVGWVSSAGGTLPVTGNVLDPTTKAAIGTIVSIVQAQGGADCVGKNPNDKAAGPGATTFNVAGVFAVVA